MICACGGGGSVGGSLTHTIVAERLFGRGEVAVASDGAGFLVASVRSGADGTPLARR